MCRICIHLSKDKFQPLSQNEFYHKRLYPEIFQVTSSFPYLQDKRKLQEEITQKRLKIEEEKLKHQHLKVIYFVTVIFMQQIAALVIQPK